MMVLTLLGLQISSLGLCYSSSSRRATHGSCSQWQYETWSLLSGQGHWISTTFRVHRSCRTQMCWARETVLWINCLLLRHENPSLDLQNQCKSQKGMGPASKPVT